MKKLFAGLPAFICILCLTGCADAGEKSNSLSLVYGVTTLLALALLAGCVRVVRKERFWFITLFTSVVVVNLGYTLLSVSTGLSMALWANRLSYLGSVFLPLSMLMILMRVTNTPRPKWLPGVLTGTAILVFLIAATPGILPLYYEEVSFAIVNGVSTLVKVYGPLHHIYLVYLLGYFAGMVALIVRANVKKTIDTTAHAVMIAMAVFVNIGVWFAEQLVAFDFEMLSVSYLISELFLLGVHLVMNEYQRLSGLLRQVEASATPGTEDATPEAMLETPVDSDAFPPERIELFLAGLQTLTPTERAIYDAFIARATTREIMTGMNIKETTVKYHSRNLYGKLGVSTRKELLEMHKHIKSIQSRMDSAQ